MNAQEPANHTLCALPPHVTPLNAALTVQRAAATTGVDADAFSGDTLELDRTKLKFNHIRGPSKACASLEQR
jgi:hypothetical protein